MEKLKIEIIGMSYSQSQSGAYALILGVVGKKTRLPIIIGGFEAQAIAIELEKMKPARPLTHDLFKRFADEVGVAVTEVIINKFEDGIFYSLLVCQKEDETIYIDSRTSDAVALALRFDAPIYANKAVIDEAGIEMDDATVEKETSDPIEEDDDSIIFDALTISELEEELKKAIEEENYEEASKIRDMIKRRKEESQ
jgi:bifunctional DNase/RNase